jgi:hypothetical protein
MDNVNNTLKQFIQAVKRDTPVRLDNKGNWYVDGKFSTLLRWIFTGGRSFVVSLIMPFISLLDALEAQPVRFGAMQTVDYKGYLEAGETLLERLLTCKGRKALNLTHQLQRRLIAIRYRFELTLPKEIDINILSSLKMQAAAWKAKQEIIRAPKLLDQDIEILEELSKYSDFSQLLLADFSLSEQFFLYAFRDCLEVPFYIQYPFTQIQLQRCKLQARIGRMGGNLLKIERVPVSHLPGVEEKIVTLPFEGQQHNILDTASVIHFRGDYSLTLAQIYEIFRVKERFVGNLEIMAEGIINWNVHKLGWWNAAESRYEVVPLLNSDWWKSLPEFEIISREEAQERYGNHLNGSVWNAAATSTRGSTTLDYENSHAYLEMAIPIDSEHYSIFDFGKFATRFPGSFLESLQMFCHTVPATVAYPDENIFYTHRQHAQHSFPLTRSQGQHILEKIRTDLVKARGNNFVYQIESENCAKWLHEKLESALGGIHNLFLMKLLDTEPLSFVKWIFAGIRNLPERFQVRVLTLFHLFLGAAQRTWVLENNRYICRSLSTHKFWNTGEVYLPAFLHHQLEKGVFSLVAVLSNQKTSKAKKFTPPTPILSGSWLGLGRFKRFTSFAGLLCLDTPLNIAKQWMSMLCPQLKGSYGRY